MHVWITNFRRQGSKEVDKKEKKRVASRKGDLRQPIDQNCTLYATTQQVVAGNSRNERSLFRIVRLD